MQTRTHAMYGMVLDTVVCQPFGVPYSLDPLSYMGGGMCFMLSSMLDDFPLRTSLRISGIS